MTQPLKPARGLIHRKISLAHFDLHRVAPSPALTSFIENYWLITWDLTGKPAYAQENLPHPAPNMVIDPQAQTGVFGVPTGKFQYRLADKGRILGTKFWPGALRTWVDRPMSELTDRCLTINEVFGVDDKALEKQLLAAADPLESIAGVEAMLLQGSPILPDKSAKTRAIVEHIERQPQLCTTAELADTFAMSPRTLQRLFDAYLGISPKWVIDRYRMLDAVEALNNGEVISLTELSHQLGYFDQAHFSKAFSALIGAPPSSYDFSG